MFLDLVILDFIFWIFEVFLVLNFIILILNSGGFIDGVVIVLLYIVVCEDFVVVDVLLNEKFLYEIIFLFFLLILKLYVLEFFFVLIE